MRLFPKLTICLGLILAAGCSKPAPRDTPPIILFSIDTLRADHLSCYGYERPTSPTLDYLAEGGVLFEETIAQAPLTAPSHMSILTSLYPPVHGIRNYGDGILTTAALPEEIVTLPQFLRENGYLTYGFTGGAQIDGERGFARGFDYYGADFLTWENDRGRHQPDPDNFGELGKKIRQAVRRSRTEGKPLFLFLHHYLCHDPYVKGPEEIRQKFLDPPVPGLVKSAEDLDFTDNPKAVREQFLAGADPGNPEHYRHFIALYDGGVYLSDLTLARILDLLQEEGIGEEALLVVTGDHGEEFYEHQGVFHFQLFREVLHVPLVMRFPHGKYGGQRITQTVRSIDIFPTIADYLGLAGELPPIQGKSLLPAIAEGETFEGKPVSFSDDNEAVRFSEGNYTYSDHDRHGTPEWLFAQGDAAEANNLAKQEQEVTEEMRRRAQAIRAGTEEFRRELVGDSVPDQVTVSPEQIEQLRALGYLN